MLRRMIVLTVLVAAFTAGCGRGEYDKQVDSAIQNAKSPPAVEPDTTGEGDAGNDAPEAK